MYMYMYTYIYVHPGPCRPSSRVLVFFSISEHGPTEELSALNITEICPTPPDKLEAQAESLGGRDPPQTPVIFEAKLPSYKS